MNKKEEKEIKEIKIKLNTKDIKEDRTASGALIDKVALALDQWTEEDLIENNNFYLFENIDYVIENNFDFDQSFIIWLNKDKKETIKRIEKISKKAKEKYQLSDLLPGAFLALEYPAIFEKELNEWISLIREESSDFYDSEILQKQAPEMKKELEEAENDFWKNLRQEWLYGDRSELGLIDKIKKDFACDDIEYDEKKDELIFSFNSDELEDLKYDYFDEDEKMTKKKVFELIKTRIENDQATTSEKQRKEAERRREERKATEKYQKTIRRADKEERKEKLRTMKR